MGDGVLHRRRVARGVRREGRTERERGESRVVGAAARGQGAQRRVDGLRGLGRAVDADLERIGKRTTRYSVSAVTNAPSRRCPGILGVAAGGIRPGQLRIRMSGAGCCWRSGHPGGCGRGEAARTAAAAVDLPGRGVRCRHHESTSERRLWIVLVLSTARFRKRYPLQS